MLLGHGAQGHDALLSHSSGLDLSSLEGGDFEDEYTREPDLGVRSWEELEQDSAAFSATFAADSADVVLEKAAPLPSIGESQPKSHRCFNCRGVDYAIKGVAWVLELMRTHV